MNLSDKGARLIATHEGLRLEPYNDPADAVIWSSVASERMPNGKDYIVWHDELPISLRSLGNSPLIRHPAFYGEYAHTPDKHASLGTIRCFLRRKDDRADSELSLSWPSKPPDLEGCDERFPSQSQAVGDLASNMKGSDISGLRKDRQGSGLRWFGRQHDGIGLTWCFLREYVRSQRRLASQAIPNNRYLQFETFATNGSLGRHWDQLVSEGVS